MGKKVKRMKVTNLDKYGKEFDINKVKLPKDLQIRIIKIMYGEDLKIK